MDRESPLVSFNTLSPCFKLIPETGKGLYPLIDRNLVALVGGDPFRSSLHQYVLYHIIRRCLRILIIIGEKNV